MSGLTEEQLAVIHFDRSKRFHKIEAVAGSGKTRTLISLITDLVSRGVNTDDFFVTTFTRSAADEIKERLHSAGNIDLRYLGTFHSLALQFIDSSQIMSLDEYPVLLLEHLKKHPWCPKYIIVDEYQDVNEIQHNIVQEFARKGDCYIFAFGDSSQNIYDWRGSKTEYFRQYLPGHQQYTLSVNFRSSPEIVELANHSKESEGSMITRNNSSDKIILAFWKTQYHEIEKIVAQVQRTWETSHTKSIAVLCRTNKPLQIVEEQMLQRRIKYSKSGRPGKVALMTLHGSKGLEWDHVFIVGCTDSTFPDEDEDEIADRRLFHVGVTRCKKRLVLSYYGKEQHPTRYIQEAFRKVPEVFKLHQTSLEDASATANRPKRAYLMDVDRWSRRLHGTHYHALRKQDMLPDGTKYEIHDSLAFPPYVIYGELEAEYSAFIEIVIMAHMGCRRMKNSEKCAFGFFPSDQSIAEREARQAYTADVVGYPEETHPVPRHFRDRVLKSYVEFTEGTEDLRVLWDIMLCEKSHANNRANPSFYKPRVKQDEHDHLFVQTVRDACTAFETEEPVFLKEVACSDFHGSLQVLLSPTNALFFHVSHEHITAEVLMKCLLALSAHETEIKQMSIYEPCQGMLHTFDLKEYPIQN